MESYYSSNQIKKMEQEATKRALELRAKATQQNQKNQESNLKKSSAFSFLNALDIKKLIGENSEQAMLLLLTLILANDNTCDEFLLYALIYIMI